MGRRSVVGVLLAAAALCGCSREPVRLGVILPSDNLTLTSVVMDSVNAAGGIRGRRLEVLRDTLTGAGWDVSQIDIRRARSVVALGVVGVVGHSGSRGSLAAAPIYNDAAVVQVVPTGTSRLLAQAGRWTFTLVPNDSVEGVFLADFVRERLRARTVVLFFVNDEYGIGLRSGFVAALRGTGVRVLREIRHNAGADLEVLVDAAVRGGAPDAVIVAGRAAETGLIARRLHELRVRTAVVAGDGAHALPQLTQAAGPGAEGIYVATFWLPDPADSAIAALSAMYRERRGTDPVATDMLVYDGLRVLVAAVQEVGASPGRVRRYLEELGVSRPRFRGVTGEIGFGPGAGSPRLVMGVVRGRQVVPVEGDAR